MAHEQTMMSTRCHKSIANAVDTTIPKTYLSRSEFLIAAIREKFERDGISYK